MLLYFFESTQGGMKTGGGGGEDEGEKSNDESWLGERGLFQVREGENFAP